MPTPGFFVLRDAVKPALPAGVYRLRAAQELTEEGRSLTSSAPIPTSETTFEITSPRYLLPPAEVLSTFPPNQAAGSFSSRLPQIVLRRRTLPWERTHDAPPHVDTPWLALVVLADGEATFLDQVPVARCVTPGVTLTGRSDSDVGSAVAVPASVVRRVFPAQDELHLLAHVREVDLSDTELALGDDDGWMAVVLSNRLPQPGVRYRACLISLEGQLDRLSLSNTHPVAASYTPPAGGLAAPQRFERLRLNAEEGTLAPSVLWADAWSGDGLEGTGRPAAPPTAEDAVGPAAPDSGSADADPASEPDPIYTFPILTSWSFACTFGGDFQSRMQALDVGLLGTVRHVPLVGPPRRVPEVLPTGHIGMDTLTRDGEPARCWYRGPFVPTPGTRAMPDAAGRLPLRHVSDQGRALGADGREQIGLAVAFEIGRLLALAEPSVVAALQRWRSARFEVARRRTLRLYDDALGDLRLASELALGHRLTQQLVNDLGRPFGLGPVRGIVDPIDDPLFTNPALDAFQVLDRMDMVEFARRSGLFDNPAWGVDALADTPGRLGGAVLRAEDLARRLMEMSLVIEASRLGGGA